MSRFNKFKSNFPSKFSKYQICDYKRPTTLLPITDNHVRWEFKINPDDDVDKLESEENIRNFMSPHMWRLNPEIDVNSGKLIRSSKYTFHGLLVDQFRVKNFTSSVEEIYKKRK